jgi:hypothetical protein
MILILLLPIIIDIDIIDYAITLTPLLLLAIIAIIIFITPLMTLLIIDTLMPLRHY